MSISFDFSALMDTAIDVVNSLLPVFQWPIAISLGIGLLSYLVNALRNILK